MLDVDGLDGVRADETAARAGAAPRTERARAITPPPLPDDAPPGVEAAPSVGDVAPSGFSLAPADRSLAPPVPSLAPRTPWLLLAAPIGVLVLVAVGWLVAARTEPPPASTSAPAPTSIPAGAATSTSAPAPAPMPASRPIVAPLPALVDAVLPAHFGFNERTPLGDARDIAAVVARCGGVATVVLTGHADALGSARANDEIALARADAVRALLAAEGIDAARVRIASAGATQPIASNASARGRRDNRRVTLHCEPHNGGEP